MRRTSSEMDSGVLFLAPDTWPIHIRQAEQIRDNGRCHFRIGHGDGLARHRWTIIAPPVLTASLYPPLTLGPVVFLDTQSRQAFHRCTAGFLNSIRPDSVRQSSSPKWKCPPAFCWRRIAVLYYLYDRRDGSTPRSRIDDEAQAASG